MGRNTKPCCLEEFRRGNTARMRIDKIRASTPPSLLGIERRMA